jgi:RNA polymerase sigma-54 factor
MGLGVQLNIRQGASLVMTPQLMQSIRLLQLTHQELEQFIAAEIEKNPLLKRDDEAADSASDAHDAAGQPSWEDVRDLAPAAGPETLAGLPDNAATEELDAPADALSPEATRADEPLLPRNGPGSGPLPHGGDFDFEDVCAARVTLKDHLASQIALLGLAPVDRMIAAALTDMLDDNGYLGAEPDVLAADLGVPAKRLTDVLAWLRGLEPVGVYASSLADCLGLQLAARNRLDPAMAALLQHLPLLAKRDFTGLQPLCGVDTSDLLDMLAEIRALDPRPGAAFLSEGAEPVVPDIIVRAAPEGGWQVQLNADALPRVLVDRDYHARIVPHVRDAKDREFLSECLKNAGWLERSLDQRATTILKVASEIVRQQDAFFLHGVAHLRPMSLRMLAEKVDLHESTVSRVTVGKYMSTPRGLFELRYFFTAAIQHAGEGELHSAEAVRHRIRGLIDAERPCAVLSDDAIVEALVADRIDIARRTVAKYREAMGIASSVERRREKKALAGL